MPLILRATGSHANVYYGLVQNSNRSLRVLTVSRDPVGPIGDNCQKYLEFPVTLAILWHVTLKIPAARRGKDKLKHKEE